jgi:hypothetical protein
VETPSQVWSQSQPSCEMQLELPKNPEQLRAEPEQLSLNEDQ